MLNILKLDDIAVIRSIPIIIVKYNGTLDFTQCINALTFPLKVGENTMGEHTTFQ